MTDYSIKTTDIARAAQCIATGRVVAVPTGTSYGLAADALQGHALQRLRNLKQRPEEKTFTVCLAPAIRDTYVRLAPQEQHLWEQLTDEAVTLLVEPTQTLAHLAQDGRIGLRHIDHPLLAQLADAVGVPITATSANIAGQPACFTPNSVAEAFPGKIDETTYDLSLGVILDAGELPMSEPSTIIRLSDGAVEVIRPGVVAQATIEKLLAT